MFANLVHLFTSGTPPATDAPGFVEDVSSRDDEKRSPRVEKVILICWLLIAAKHLTVLWAVHRYAVPFNPLWVNLPTWLLGVLATVIYFVRVRDR